MLDKIYNLLFFILPIVRFRVKGKSMEPYFFSGETLFVNKFFYLFQKPKIGDVIILKNPKDNNYIIKTIDKINQEKYFVLGYNLKESTDSRVFGWVPKKYIIGKAIKIYN